MSSRESDALRIPIEIKTEDMAELQQLLQQITEAENDLSRIKSTGITRGAQNQTFAGQARGAGGMTSTTEGRGGIFESRLMEGGATPMSLRDRSGKQAHTRENAFNALQDKVNSMQEEQAEQTAGMIDQMMGMASGYVPFIGGSKIASFAQRKLSTKIRQNLGAPVPKGQTKLPVAVGGRMTGLMARAAPLLAAAGPIGAVVAAAMAAIFVGKQFADWMQGPGGFWDIRYKRHIGKELDPFLERREKQEINIGLRTVRVTSSPAIRSSNQVFSTQQAVKRGIPIYNGEFEAFSKGLYI